MATETSGSSPWTEGAARAVRAAVAALEEDSPDLRLTVAQIDTLLADNAEAHEEADALRAEVEQLKEALVSRATIEQAKGVLMAAESSTPDEAFEVLKRASQRENVKVRDIAARIVEHAGRGETRLGPERTG